jgi:hypothetical protein
MGPLREDRLVFLKEDQQIGRAVEVDVDDGAHMFARRSVEFLDQIDSIVEVAVRLAAYEATTFVVLVNIR